MDKRSQRAEHKKKKKKKNPPGLKFLHNVIGATRRHPALALHILPTPNTTIQLSSLDNDSHQSIRGGRRLGETMGVGGPGGLG